MKSGNIDSTCVNVMNNYDTYSFIFISMAAVYGIIQTSIKKSTEQVSNGTNL